MIDRRLSDAVVVFIWGSPRSTPYPSEHSDDLAVKFGEDEALDLEARVRRILAEVYAEPLELPGEDLHGSSNRIEALIHCRYPELNADALTAIGTHFAYNTK